MEAVRTTALAGILIVTLAALPAAASDHAAVTAAWGDLEFSTWSGSAHSPDCWADWEQIVGDGTAFYEVVEGWYAPRCGTYTVQCANDSLACHGVWSEIDVYMFFHYLHYRVELGCTLAVTQPIQLTMSRDLPVPLSAASHRFEITDPGGTVTTYLGDHPEDQAEVELAEGVYTVRLLTEFWYYDSEDLDWRPPYDGTVTASWTDLDVAAGSATWTTVKRLFR